MSRYRAFFGKQRNRRLVVASLGPVVLTAIYLLFSINPRLYTAIDIPYILVALRWVNRPARGR